MSGQDQYVEALASELYWTAEQWFRRVDPYHAQSPVWPALREDRKAPYREMAARTIELDRRVQAEFDAAMGGS